VWSPEATTCTLLNIETTKLAVISTLVTDVVLLLLMAIGLFRMHRGADSVPALGRILWKHVSGCGSRWL